MRLAFVLAVASLAMAGALPLTTSDVSLMLRAGYSAQSVEQELAARHFADTLDDAKRAQLLKAGATPQLLDALQTGKFSAPKDELEKLRRKNQLEGERALAAAQQPVPLLPKTKAAPTPSSLVDVIAQAAKGNLVRCQNGNLRSSYDDELSAKKIYGLYFSAHWCPPCRKFTPTLVAYYNQVAREHPEFEIIFVSSDKTPEAMAAYMRDSAMPWPAIEYAKVQEMSALRKYAGSGIPDLVIVDGGGKVLLDSYVQGEYVGPERVLAQLDSILAGLPPQLAANR